MAPAKVRISTRKQTLARVARVWCFRRSAFTAVVLAQAPSYTVWQSVDCGGWDPARIGSPATSSSTRVHTCKNIRQGNGTIIQKSQSLTESFI